MTTKPILRSSATPALPSSSLRDADGPIPTFPPRALDERGRLVPISAEERRARSEAVVRALKAVASLRDDDPPGTAERMMRGIDDHRPPDAKLFEGLY